MSGDAHRPLARPRETRPKGQRQPPPYAEAPWVTPAAGTTVIPSGSTSGQRLYGLVHLVARIRTYTLGGHGPVPGGRSVGRRIVSEWQAVCGDSGEVDGRPPAPGTADGVSRFDRPGKARSSNRCRWCWPQVSDPL